MSKKLIFISIGLLVILSVLVGYYFLSSNGGGGGGIIPSFNLFPFGNNSGGNGNQNSDNGDGGYQNATTTEEVNAEDYLKKLRRLSKDQVSGAGLVETKTGTTVRYIEKATGHIYEVDLFSPRNERISNTTIPTVYDAVWGNKSNSLIARYLKDDDITVDTYSLTIKNTSTTTENMVSGIAFPANITDVVVFENNVFYLENGSSFSVGYTLNFDGKNKKQIWNSPIKELNSQYVNTKTVALTTKPLKNLPGYLYLVDTGTGGVKSVLNNTKGLSTLVDSFGEQVLYLEQTSIASLSVFNIKNKTNKTVPFITFPEKCVWSKKEKNIVYCAVPEEYISGDSLTNWYKGLVSFTDSVVKYDITNDTQTKMYSLPTDSKIDIIKPQLNANEQYLIFTNKIDNSLWSLDLVK